MEPELPVCGICLEELGEGAEVGELDSCNHRLCYPCVSRWAEIESRCPFCKLRFVVLRRKALGSRDELLGADANAPLPGRYLDQQEVPERNQRVHFEDPSFEAWIAEVVCLLCGGGEDEDQLLLCDECDRACHTYCAGLDGIPEGEWFCPQCQEARAAAAAAAAAAERRRRRAGGRQGAAQPARRGAQAGSAAAAAAGARQQGRRAQQEQQQQEEEEAEDLVVLLSSEDEEEEARPARRQRTSQQHQRRGWEALRRRPARQADRLDGFIVSGDSDEEEEGDAEWDARQLRGAAAASQRQRGRRGVAGARRGQSRAAAAAASDSESDWLEMVERDAGGRVGGSRRGQARRRGSARQGDIEEEGFAGVVVGSEEEQEEPEADSSDSHEEEEEEELPLALRLEARGAGVTRRRRGRSQGTATAAAAARSGRGDRVAPRPGAGAAVGAGRAAQGATAEHRHVDALRANWEAIRQGRASFRSAAGPPAATAAPAAAAAAPSGGRRRLVRAAELGAAAADFRPDGAGLDSDPARRAAVAALRARQAAASPAEQGPVDLTSPSPQGARGPLAGGGNEEELRAWQAMDQALAEARQAGGGGRPGRQQAEVRQQRQGGRRQVLDSDEEGQGQGEEEDDLNLTLAARLRRQIAACRDVGRQLVPRFHNQQQQGQQQQQGEDSPAGAAAAGAAASRRTPGRAPVVTPGAAPPGSASPPTTFGRRHARTMGDMRFAASVARGTPLQPGRAGGQGAQRTQRGPGAAFVIPRRAQQQQQQQQQQQRQQQDQQLQVGGEPERRDRAQQQQRAAGEGTENSRPRPPPLFSSGVAWPRPPQQQQQQHQQEQEAALAGKPPPAGTDSNPFSHFSMLQPLNRGSGSLREREPGACPLPASAAPGPCSLNALPASAAMPARPASKAWQPLRPSLGTDLAAYGSGAQGSWPARCEEPLPGGAAASSAPCRGSGLGSGPSPPGSMPRVEWAGFSQPPEWEDSEVMGDTEPQSTPALERLVGNAVVPSSTPFMRSRQGAGAGGSSREPSSWLRPGGSPPDRWGPSPSTGGGGSSGRGGSGGERPSKEEVYERVKVHLKQPYKRGHLDKEQYKQVAREVTRLLRTRGRIEDADVAAAVQDALARL